MYTSAHIYTYAFIYTLNIYKKYILLKYIYDLFIKYHTIILKFCPNKIKFRFIMKKQMKLNINCNIRGKIEREKHIGYTNIFLTIWTIWTLVSTCLKDYSFISWFFIVTVAESTLVKNSSGVIAKVCRTSCLRENFVV